MGAEMLGQNDAAGTNAATGAENEHAIARLDGAVGDEHAVRGSVGDRQRGRRLETHAGRHGDELVGGDAAIFRHAAVEHLAHEAFRLVERVDEHAVAHVPAADAISDLGDLARHVETDHDRQRHFDAWHAAHREYVVIVE